MLDISEWVLDNVLATALSHISLNGDGQVQVSGISTAFYVIHSISIIQLQKEYLMKNG